MELVRQWIELNRAAIIAYWNGDLLADEVMARLKPLSLREVRTQRWISKDIGLPVSLMLKQALAEVEGALPSLRPAERATFAVAVTVPALSPG